MTSGFFGLVSPGPGAVANGNNQKLPFSSSLLLLSEAAFQHLMVVPTEPPSLIHFHLSLLSSCYKRCPVGRSSLSSSRRRRRVEAPNYPSLGGGPPVRPSVGLPLFLAAQLIFLSRNFQFTSSSSSIAAFSPKGRKEGHRERDSGRRGRKWARP